MNFNLYASRALDTYIVHAFDQILHFKLYFCIFLHFRGKFGRVVRCKHRDKGQFFAAKFVRYTRKEERENVEREVQIMNSLAHPKLLFLYDAYDNGRNEMCLVTE